MGCGPSRNTLETVDDSVHVMLQHDKKAAQKAGKTVTGYVPRAEHPLLAAQNESDTPNPTKVIETAPCCSKKASIEDAAQNNVEGDTGGGTLSNSPAASPVETAEQSTNK